MFKLKIKILTCLFGIWFHQAFAVINQKNEITLNEKEAANVDQFSTPQYDSKDSLEARISDFEATTPVFPLTAPTYDYSPLGLSPPEDNDIPKQQQGYSYEAPTATPTSLLYDHSAIQSQPEYGPPSNSYLPPKKTSFVIPKQSLPLPSPSKPSYINSAQPVYNAPFKQSYSFPASSPKLTFNPSEKYNFNSHSFQYHPSVKAHHVPFFKSRYGSRPNYQLPNLKFNIPSSQYSSFDVLQPTYVHPKKDYFSSQQTGIPIKTDGGNLATKYSAYDNLKYNIYSLLGNVPHTGSSKIQSPPTPPVISYDGWRPLSGVESKDLLFNSFIANDNPLSSQNYFELNKFENKPSFQQLFPLSDNYYDTSLLSNNQFSSSHYEPPSDFTKSFLNLALNDNGRFNHPPSTLSNNVFQISPNNLLCDELSTSQITANGCCTPSIPSEILKDSYQGSSQTFEQPGLAYGVPSGKQIDGPKLQPKVPVKFRPPVPSGLLESIGKTGQNGLGNTHGFRGETYIPPAIPEVSKSSESSSNLNDYSNNNEQINKNSFEKDTAQLSLGATSNTNSADIASSQYFDNFSGNKDVQPLTHALQFNEQSVISSPLTQLPSFGNEQTQYQTQIHSVDGNNLGDQMLSRDLLQQIILAVEQNQPAAPNAFYEKSDGSQAINFEHGKNILLPHEEIHQQNKRNVASNQNQQKLDSHTSTQS